MRVKRLRERREPRELREPIYLSVKRPKLVERAERTRSAKIIMTQRAK